MKQIILPFKFYDKVISINTLCLKYTSVKRIYENIVHSVYGCIDPEEITRKNNFYSIVNNYDLIYDEMENIIFKRIRFDSDKEKNTYLKDINKILNRLDKFSNIKKHQILVDI